MNDNNGYAVFFFPQALEALGDAIRPYLKDGPAGPHVVCGGIDTGGALIEMTLSGTAQDGEAVEIELMIPSGMVRMIVSAHSDEMFGFAPQPFKGALQKVAPVAEGGEGKTAAVDAQPVKPDQVAAAGTGAAAAAVSPKGS